jgi:diacylglycerol O-acyltransferase / wax synthase
MSQADSPSTRCESSSRRPEELPERERVPSDAELLLGAATSIARQPLRMVRAGRNLARSAIRVVQRVRSGPVSAGVPLTAPASPLNGVLTPHRRVTFTSVPLADIKEVKRAFGVTVNDVVLAVCAGALRRFLELRGKVPDKPLLAAIHASVRTPDERRVLGNRVSAMFATLATQLDDPVDRLFAAREVMGGAKLVHEDMGGTRCMNGPRWRRRSCSPAGCSSTSESSRVGIRRAHRLP